MSSNTRHREPTEPNPSKDWGRAEASTLPIDYADFVEPQQEPLAKDVCLHGHQLPALAWQGLTAWGIGRLTRGLRKSDLIHR